MSGKKRVVIVGGGFAGSPLAQQLQKMPEYEVTLVDRKEYFDWNFVALRGAVDTSVVFQSRYADFLKEARVVVGEVTEVSPTAVTLASGESLAFDYLVIALGSLYSAPMKTTMVTVAERRAELAQWHAMISGAKHVLIAGGGPSGVEFAGEIVTEFPNTKVTLVSSHETVLPAQKPKTQAAATALLAGKGVTVVTLERTPRDLAPGRHDPTQAITLTKSTKDSGAGTVVEGVDLYIPCTGSGSASAPLRTHFAAALTSDGRLRVTPQLTVVGHPRVFALGDINDVPRKNAYSAGLHAAVVLKTLKAPAVRSAPAAVDITPNVKGVATNKLAPDAIFVTFGRHGGVSQLPFGVMGNRFTKALKSADVFVSKQSKLFPPAKQ